MGRGSGTYNPYRPDAGARPPVLAGRGGQLNHFRSIITQLGAGGGEKHVLLTGLRGVGKTVLLNEFETLCAGAGWPGEAKEVGRETQVSVLVGRVVRRALLEMSTKKRMQDRLKRAMAVLSSFEVTLPEGVTFRLDVSPEVGQADSGDLADDLRDVLVAAGEAAVEADVGFALILDEVHSLGGSDYEALIMALHRVNQKNLPVAFVGAGLPLIPGLTAEAKSYAERMFIYPELGSLDHDAAVQALVEPAEQQGVKWEEAAVEQVLIYTERYPYFLQEFGRHAWQQGAGDSITAQEGAAAQVLVEDYLDDNFFEPRISHLTNSEQAYVSAIADLGDGPQQTAAVAKRLGRTQGAVSTVRESLIESAVIYSPERGAVDFTVPHCAAFVRRRYPV